MCVEYGVFCVCLIENGGDQILDIESERRENGMRGRL